MSPDALPLPERPDLIIDNRTRVTGRFLNLLARWRAEIEQVFRPENNEHASPIDSDPYKIFAQYSKRPTLAIEMALEIATMILETEASDGVLLGKKAYAHQLAQLKWLVMSLLEGGTSYVIEGAPGTGKTLILGAIIAAATRLQVRNLMQGAIIYGTHRPYILSQQTFSAAERRDRLLLQPDTREMKEEMEYFSSKLGLNAHEFLSREDWLTLHRRRYVDREEVVEHIHLLLKKKDGGEDFFQKNKDAFLEIARLFTGEGVLVFDIDESMMLLPLFPAPVTDAENPQQYSGDIGRGIPHEYVDKGFVSARRGAEVGDNRIDRSKKRREELLAHTRVLLTIATTITRSVARASIRTLLKHTKIVVIDEGLNPATVFQDAVHEASDGQAEIPLVFMASALSTTNGMGSRPHADRYSSRLTMDESMEPGPDGRQVSPNIGVDMFPHKSGVLYSDNTVEALHQLITAHFADLELPEKTNLPQPYMSTTLMVVSPDSVVQAVRMLRDEYKKRNIPADIIPFRNNSERPSTTGNTKQPHSERVLQVMMDDHVEKNGRRVRILVSSADNIKDALSIPNLQNVTIATAHGIGKSALMRIYGRLLHSNLHHTLGPKHRGYFRQGLYQNTIIQETIFHLLGKKHGDSMQWVPLQTLKGEAGAKADESLVQGLSTIKVPLSHAELHKRKEKKGLSVTELALQRERAKTPVVSRHEAAAKVEHSFMWGGLYTEGRKYSPVWGQENIRMRFMKLVVDAVADIVPSFMAAESVWKKYSRYLMQHIAQYQTQDPEAVVDAAKGYIVRHVRMGKAEEQSVVSVASVIASPEELDDHDDELPEWTEPSIDPDDDDSDAPPDIGMCDADSIPDVF